MSLIVTGDEAWIFYNTPESKQRWLGARTNHDVVQSAGSRILWLGETEVGSKT
jgi:hypothetical protein